jgi:ABC-2 type transport system permease protein
VAERVLLAPPGREPAPGTLTAFRALVRSRARSQLVYRTSFAFDVVGSAATSLVEFAELYVVFSNVKLLGGLDLTGAMLVFAFSNIAFSLADLAVGQLDNIPTLIRTGTLDAVLLRPLPVLLQLSAHDISLRRLGRTVVGLTLLAVALTRADLAWTPARVLLVALTPLAGAAIFAALFLAAGAAQFWLVDGAEVTNAFTYGSSFASSYPGSVYSAPVRSFFTFVVPALFTAYLPVLALLGCSSTGLPGWLGWCTPVVAVLTWTAALLAWRAGLRRYTGAGG